MRLLVTRHDPDWERTAKALEALGHEVVISPALDIRYLIDAPVSATTPQAILVTSVNAVRALTRHKQSKMLMAAPVLAVGDRTAVEARRAGFASALSAQGTVDDLNDLVRQLSKPENGALLYAAGADQAGNLAERLIAAGFEVETAVVYRAETTPELTAEGRQALQDGQVDGVLFYSARSASAFGEQLGRAGLQPLAETIGCYCLSDAVAEAVRSYASGPVHVAAKPDQLALFAVLDNESP